MEDRIRRILTSKKLPEVVSNLSKIAAGMQKTGSLQCLFFLAMNKGTWKEATEFCKRNGFHVSDGTFRARMTELEQLKLAFHEYIDPSKKEHTATELGRIVAELLLEFLERMEQHI